MIQEKWEYDASIHHYSNNWKTDFKLKLNWKGRDTSF